MSRLLQGLAALAQEQGLSLFHLAELDGEAAAALEIAAINPCVNAYSIAKVFTMTAVGLLCDRGLLGLEEKPVDILRGACPNGMDPRWRSITVEMAMTHRLGLPAGCLDIDAADARSFGQDYLHYLMKVPLEANPGDVFRYTDAAFYLLSRVVEQRAGRHLDDFLWREILYPLGFREAAFSRCPLGHAVGATGLYARASDIVKLGALYRDGGIWKGKRLLSINWVEMALARRFELTPVGIGSAFGKAGMCGQMLLVIPETGRVVCWQGYESRSCDRLIQFAAEYR